MKRIFAAAFFFALSIGTALAQQITLPSNTVYGRLGITNGPAQAIPFSVLAAQLSQLSPLSTLNAVYIYLHAAAGGL